MNTRRNFIAALLGAGACALDPERLLWRPGAKLISIPTPSVVLPVRFLFWLDGLKGWKEIEGIPAFNSARVGCWPV